MFERRLKTLGLILAGLSVILLIRLVQVQVFGRAHYAELARKAMTQNRMIPTARGPILDVRGRVLAADEACIDAAVDFRAVARDRSQPFVKSWVKQVAAQRLRANPAYVEAGPELRKQMREAEPAAVERDIAGMWADLARAGGVTVNEIDDIRTAIEVEVRKKRNSIVQGRFRQALTEAETREKPAWYARWLAGGSDDLPTEEEFEGDLIYEQQSSHVVVRALTPTAQNNLGRNLDSYPGLQLLPSKHRVYPYRQQAAHVVGYLTRVQREQIIADPESGNALREYLPNDLAGRDGIEALAERSLRGSRGMESQVSGAWKETSRIDPTPGEAVTSTIDIELQAHIRELFTKVQIPRPGDSGEIGYTGPMHGSAVVIDIATGEVRALVSYPDYDLNSFTEMYSSLRDDEGNMPLFHRAVMSQYEPGSTVKPIVGIAAISAGLASLADRIECTGFLTIRGQRHDAGRCWTATIVPGTVFTHHNTPWNDPHPTGYLNFHDAIQRSCNIYFENMAEKLGTEGLSVAMQQFGFGRYSGLGIAEKAGRLPRDYRGPVKDFARWMGGIGQVSVLATPLQVANASATIARRGVWMRPRIVRDTGQLTPWQPAVGDARHVLSPDVVDLKLDPAAVQTAIRGMIDVVETEAGSGNVLRRAHVSVAAKTGTAQASAFRYWTTDAEGKRVRVTPRPATWEQPNAQFPWYRASDSEGKKLHHAWMTGFAPKDNPTIAFAVLVEYAGTGGGSGAGPIAAELLDACIEHGYVPKTK